MPFLSTVHLDTALTDFSQAITQLGLVGDKVFPVKAVDKRSDRWFVYGNESFIVRDDIVRPGSAAAEVDYSLSQSTYNAERHALKEIVTDADMRTADDPLSPKLDATEQLTNNVQTNREAAQAAIGTSTASLTQNSTLSGTSQWSDYTNSTPLTNIRSARSAVRLGVARPANMITAGYDVCLVLADHPSVKDLIKYTNPGNISESGLPNIIRGLAVNEASAVSVNTNLGQTLTFGDIGWGKNAIVHYTNPAPARKSITLGMTLEAPDDTTGARGFSVRSWRDEDRAGEMVEVGNTYTIVMVAPLAGYLFAAAIA